MVLAAEVFGLGRADLAALARNAVAASSLDDAGRREVTAEIDALAGG